MKENAAEGLLPIVQYMADYLDAARKIEALDFDKGYTEVAKWENLAKAQEDAANAQRGFAATSERLTGLAEKFDAVGASAPIAAQGINDAGEAAANAQMAFFDAAAGLSEMNAAMMVKTRLEALEGAGLDAEALVIAQEALLRQFGLLTDAEVSASGAMAELDKMYGDGSLGAEAYAAAVAALKHHLDTLESKDITIDVHFNVDELRIPTARSIEEQGPGLIQTPTPIMNATGGDYIVSQPTSFVAGEAGTERVIVIPQGRPGFGGTGGGMGGGASKIEINVHGTNDPEAAANLVIRKLADRGIVAAGGGLR